MFRCGLWSYLTLQCWCTVARMAITQPNLYIEVVDVFASPDKGNSCFSKTVSNLNKA